MLRSVCSHIQNLFEGVEKKFEYKMRLKYALTYHEVKMIVLQRLIKADGKVRADMFYLAGFQDVVEIEKARKNFRLLYDTKGHIALHKVVKEETAYKLCRVKKVLRGPKGVP
jgi:small subunit ribosomal protein S4e